VPGDAACRPIMDCGSGTWGNIPVDANTIYVNADYPNGDSDGSELKPFTEIAAALAATQGGELIAIAEGGYIDDVIINKPVTLHGLCPELTRILGDPFDAAAAIEISAAANGTSIIGLRVTDLQTSAGIEVDGATGVTIDRVRVTNNIGRGIAVRSSGGQAGEATIKDSLIDDNREVGVFAYGSKVTIERTQIRDTQEYGSNSVGIAVDINHDGDVQADVTIRGTLVERSAFFGVNAYGSAVLVEDSVIRDTQPRSPDGFGGRGINVQFEFDEKVRASATVRRSYIADNHDCALFGASSDVTIEHSVLRATHPDMDGLGTGIAMQASSAAQTDSASQLQLTASVVEAHEGGGLFVSNSDASIERTVVRDTLPQQDGLYGRGVYFRIDDIAGTPAAKMDLVGSLVDNNTDVGVFVSGAVLSMKSTIVSNTQPDIEGPGGRGVSIQQKESLGTPADVTIDSSIVERNSNHGIYITGSSVVITSSIVRDTAMDLLKSDGRGVSLQNLGAAQTIAIISDSIFSDNTEFGLFVIGSRADIDGSTISDTAAVMGATERVYGDGIAVVAELAPTQLSLVDCNIANNERAGVLDFSGDLSLGGTQLMCNEIDLVDSSQGALSFDNTGGNSCGCPGGEDDCKWLGSSVALPASLPPADESGDQ